MTQRGQFRMSLDTDLRSGASECDARLLRLLCAEDKNEDFRPVSLGSLGGGRRAPRASDPIAALRMLFKRRPLCASISAVRVLLAGTR